MVLKKWLVVLGLLALSSPSVAAEYLAVDSDSPEAIEAAEAVQAGGIKAGVFFSDGDHVHVSSTPPRTLSAHGFAIAIDDFGTGYSNLAYLRRLPVHALKLAGSFVTGLREGDNGDSTGEDIMRMLVELSHTLALRVTAEGIETDEQARQLRDLGCDNGQGWLFGKPGSPEAINDLLDAARGAKTSA